MSLEASDEALVSQSAASLHGSHSQESRRERDSWQTRNGLCDASGVEQLLAAWNRGSPKEKMNVR